jgi:hypothetical protein
MLGALAVATAIALVIALGFMATGFGKRLYAAIERFPKFLAFLSGAIVGALFGLIPGASLGWLMGSRIVGAVICLLCAAGAGYAWMRIETGAESKRALRNPRQRRDS